MLRLLKTEHLHDQLAALAWLRKQEYVRPTQIAAAGNSFGGIETLLGAETGQYCAGVDVSGGADNRVSFASTRIQRGEDPSLNNLTNPEATSFHSAVRRSEGTSVFVAAR